MHFKLEFTSVPAAGWQVYPGSQRYAPLQTPSAASTRGAVESCRFSSPICCATRQQLARCCSPCDFLVIYYCECVSGASKPKGVRCSAHTLVLFRSLLCRRGCVCCFQALLCWRSTCYAVSFTKKGSETRLGHGLTGRSGVLCYGAPGCFGGCSSLWPQCRDNAVGLSL